MSFIWSLVLFVHILAATFWVGGQLMLALVVLPLVRRIARPELVSQLATLSGRRFAILTNFVLFPTLVITGVLFAWHDGVRFSNLTSTSFGHVLVVKVILVGVVFTLASAHGFAARRLSRHRARTLALVTMSLSVLIVLLAAALAVLPGP